MFAAAVSRFLVKCMGKWNGFLAYKQIEKAVDQKYQEIKKGLQKKGH